MNTPRTDARVIFDNYLTLKVNELERELTAEQEKVKRLREALELSGKYLHALLDRNITYNGENAVLRFESHDQAMNHILQAREHARAILEATK